MSKRAQFAAEWTILTTIGIIIGTWVGADQVGFVQGVLGDILLGLVVGVAQTVVLLRHFRDHSRSLVWWVAACTAAFTVGAVLGRRAAPFLLNYGTLAATIGFGLTMGVSHGLLQWFVLSRTSIFQSRAIRWIVVGFAAWFLGELVGTGFGLIQWQFWLSIPTGLAIGLVMGSGWITLMGVYSESGQ
jgi:hypothetical protein